MRLGEGGKSGVRFAGYAAIFDQVDNGGDIVRAGAFSAALRSRQVVPLLWQHKSGAVIGRIEKLQEDARGLRVIGRLGGHEAALQVDQLVRSGKLSGLSFGYRVRRSSAANGVRELAELDLIEVSVVDRPMQPLARIHAVQSD